MHMVEEGMWWRRACGGGGHVVEEGVWWRRACGGGGHVVEEGMWWRRACGGGEHGEKKPQSVCKWSRVHRPTEKEYVVKIFCLSDCQLYRNCFKSPDFSSHLCTYIYIISLMLPSCIK